MPYLFGGLVFANALLLGYFIFLHQPETKSATFEQTKAQISNPLTFENASARVPPVIGAKK